MSEKLKMLFDEESEIWKKIYKVVIVIVFVAIAIAGIIMAFTVSSKAYDNSFLICIFYILIFGVADFVWLVFNMLILNFLTYVQNINEYVVYISKLIKHYKEKEKSAATQNSQLQESGQSATDEVMKYKELKDQGVITEEEFQAKKEQLLKLL